MKATYEAPAIRAQGTFRDSTGYAFIGFGGGGLGWGWGLGWGFGGWGGGGWGGCGWGGGWGW